MTCSVCSAPTDVYLCALCLSKLEHDLGDIAWLAEELDTTIARLDKQGKATVGFVRSGGDEQPLPLNLGAVEAKHKLRDFLWSWTACLWEAFGVRDTNGQLPKLALRIDLVDLSRWLLRHPTWIADHEAAEYLYKEIRGAVSKAFRAVDAAPDKVFIGPCSTEQDGFTCEQDVYAVRGRDNARCRTCGAEHVVSERRKVMAGAVAHQELTAEELSRALPEWLGVPVTSSQIRQWAFRKVPIEGTDKKRPMLPKAGMRKLSEGGVREVPTYRVGDVLDILMPKDEEQAA